MGTLANAIGVLGVLSTALEAVPIVGSNLKVAAELASKICETVQNIKGNRKSYEDLALHVEQLLVAISTALQNARPERLGAMTANVERLMKVLKEIQVAIHDRTRSNTPSPVGACGPLSTWLCNAATDVTHMAADEDNVKEMRRKLDEVVVEFDVGSHMRTELRVENVESLVRLAAANISQIQVQMQANNERATRQEESRLKAERDAENILLETLNPVPSATWQARATEVCTPETRVVLLDEVMSWVDDPAGSCVFWLNGLAGTGKSTIARTICQRLSARALLGANFFVDRQQQDRRNASSIVRTLAHQLALRHRSLAAALCLELRESPVSAPRSLETEIADFIGKPAARLGDGDSFVMVLDALDECLPDDFGRPGGELLVFLVRQLMGLSRRLKLLITSRAGGPIQQMFDGLTAHSQHTVVQLHDLDSTVVAQDIRTYLLSAFAEIRVRRLRLNLCDWPLAKDLEHLVRVSGLLFVYSATAIRFVGDHRYSPRDRLAQILGQKQAGGLTQSYKTLDRLYMQILIDAVNSSNENEEDDDQATADLCRRLQSVIAAIVLAQTPLRVDDVAILAGQSLDDARIVADTLSALLLIGSGEAVQIFHPSFLEFVTDPLRCDNSRLYVDPAKHHADIALRCLLVMNNSLRYDICNIQDPNIANADVMDLETRLRESVSDALQYACRFWTVHLAASGISDQDSVLTDALTEFSRKHLFHWLEVLSLLQRLAPVEMQLLKTIEWCERFPADNTLSLDARLFHDTVRTLQAYGLPLRSHALHTYHSAFITMPHCPLLETLQQETPPQTLPTLISPRGSRWDLWNRVFDGHEDEVLCVAFSPDGEHVVSGARDGTVRVWSAITLEELAKLTSDDRAVSSIAFSPDSTQMVTSSGAFFIYVWNFVTLEQAAILELNQVVDSRVRRFPVGGIPISAMFSRDGTQILGSEGDNIGLWSSISFEKLGTLRGRAPFAISPDGKHVVARADTTSEVVVFDALTSEELVRLEEFPSGVRVIAFSPDGGRVVLGVENDLKVWDARTWKQMASLKGHTLWVDSAAFSPCGTWIVSASADETLRLWDGTSYKELAKFKGREYSVPVLAFSPDGTQLVLGSEDKALRVWSVADITDCLGLEDDRSRRDRSRDITFSPCGTRILSHSVDGPVRVWDADTFDELGELQHLRQYGREQEVVVCSPDGSLITTRHGPHNSLMVWNAVTFEIVTELERGFDFEFLFTSAAFSPDSKRIVSGMRNGAVLVWSILSSEVLAEFNELDDWIRCVAHSRGSAHFAAGNERKLRVWSAETFEEIHVSHPSGSATCVDFSHDGASLVTLFFTKKKESTVCVVWSVDTFQVLAQLETADFYREPAFTPDGRGVVFYNIKEDADGGLGTTSAWMPSNGNHAVWVEVPLSAIGLPTNATSFGAKRMGMHLSPTGWLRCWVDSTLRLIWLPMDRRSSDRALCGTRVAIVGEHRALTVLKFPGQEGQRQDVMTA